MQMVRKRLIVKGNVQGVGYRALVKLIARSLGVKGWTRNQDDGSVEIFCEGDVGVLARFVSVIDINRRNGNLLAIDVKGIEEHMEGTNGYATSAASRAFDTFEIEYGQDLSCAEKEMIERQELLIVGGSQVLDGLTVVGEKLDGVGQDVKSVGGKVDNMHEDMNKRFLEMNEKYHVISEVLIAHTDALTKLVNDYIETKEKKNA